MSSGSVTPGSPGNPSLPATPTGPSNGAFGETGKANPATGIVLGTLGSGGMDPARLEAAAAIMGTPEGNNMHPYDASAVSSPGGPKMVDLETLTTSLTQAMQREGKLRMLLDLTKDQDIHDYVQGIVEELEAAKAEAEKVPGLSEMIEGLESLLESVREELGLEAGDDVVASVQAQKTALMAVMNQIEDCTRDNVVTLVQELVKAKATLGEILEKFPTADASNVAVLVETAIAATHALTDLVDEVGSEDESQLFNDLRELRNQLDEALPKDEEEETDLLPVKEAVEKVLESLKAAQRLIQTLEDTVSLENGEKLAEVVSEVTTNSNLLADVCDMLTGEVEERNVPGLVQGLQDDSTALRQVYTELDKADFDGTPTNAFNLTARAQALVGVYNGAEVRTERVKVPVKQTDWITLAAAVTLVATLIIGAFAGMCFVGIFPSECFLTPFGCAVAMVGGVIFVTGSATTIFMRQESLEEKRADMRV